MTDNVLARQLAEGNSVYFFQYLHCHIKAGACTGRKVLLRGISGYNDFGTETDTGQEHLHLRRCRILCLIKDNKRIVERTASHVRERRNLNQAFFHVFLEALCSHDLIQRVVERPQIRVNFTLQVARQETEFFTRLNRRTRQDNTAYLIVSECRDRHRHCKVCFSGSGRADAEDDHLFPDRIHVRFLTECFRFDRTACDRVADAVTVDFRKAASAVLHNK